MKNTKKTTKTTQKNTTKAVKRPKTVAKPKTNKVLGRPAKKANKPATKGQYHLRNVKNGKKSAKTSKSRTVTAVTIYYK